MARRKDPVLPEALLDRLLGGVDAKSAFDGGGRIEALTQALAGRALNAAMDRPLLSEGSSGNRRNGFGLWIETNEGATFWLRGMNELKHRGAEDSLMAVVGPKGFSDAINALFPQTTVPTGIVHLLRTSLDFASWKDRRDLARAMTLISSAVDGADLVRGRLLGAEIPGCAGQRGRRQNASSLVLNRSEKEWTIPPREWPRAKSQFAVLFANRFQAART